MGGTVPVVPHYPSDEPDDEALVDPDSVRRRILGADRDRRDEDDRSPTGPILRVA